MFSHDYSVYPLAKKLLENDEYYFKLEAFKLVSNTNPIDAVEYANKNLRTDSFKSLNHEMALVLAEHDIKSKQFKSYIDTLFSIRGELQGWLYQYFDIFSLLNKGKSGNRYLVRNDSQLELFRESMAINMLVNMIDDGNYIMVDESIYRNKLVFGKIGSAVTPISRWDLGKIYENVSLLNKLVKLKNDVGWIR